MDIAGIIPARFASTRYPGKPLVPLLGKPMVIWVAEATARALGRESTFVATDDDRIARVVEDHGFQHVMTSRAALTGTDRLQEASDIIAANIYLNVQGDEPAVSPSDISAIAEAKRAYPDRIINGMRRIDGDENPMNVNLPKVVAAEDGRLLYMSRLPVPGAKSKEKRPREYWKQVCIYAFTKGDLDAFASYGRKGYSEGIEDIEILRFLELGRTVWMVEMHGQNLAVDEPGDVAAVEEALRRIHYS